MPLILNHNHNHILISIDNLLEEDFKRTNQSTKLEFYCDFMSVEIAGLGMTYYYAFGKNTDADGNGYYVYDESTRKFGTILFFGGITLVIIEFSFVSYLLPYTYNYY